MARRLLSIWFPRLASDAALRTNPVEGAFALILRSGNVDLLHCLNAEAERSGLFRGMPLADARAVHPDVLTRPAESTIGVQEALRRWAVRYSPHVAADGPDGLISDVTGIAHLFGGEDALQADLRARLEQAGFTARSAIADTRGAAHALARHGGTLADLPVVALRIDPGMAEALSRLGLRRVGDLLPLPRAPLARRFGAELVLRLDQMMGDRPEPVAAPPNSPNFAVRMALPEPIGLYSDVMAGLARLLDRLCAALVRHMQGARRLRLEMRRVDHKTVEVEIGLARPMRDPSRIARLFAPKLEKVDAGYGIDALRLVVTLAEPLAPLQTNGTPKADEAMADLISRLGNRLGFENILRLEPTDSLIPERSFRLVPAAEARPGPLPRLPAVIFRPEPVTGTPPDSFHWRGQRYEAHRATGPERISPDWWEEDPAWASGLRDYWRVQTRQGPRLWLFHTPQAPAWFAQGQFA
ncbi:DNA polymerase Y family protein [Cereibacter sp. SYSU M97828]|nr:DNA polymerase Y family protein [Cereibacter flavus]